MTYESTVTANSKSLPDVRFRVYRMSFGRRLKLTRRVKELFGRLEFVLAGDAGPKEEAERALLCAEIDQEYVKWGLAGVEGLEIDSKPATPESLVEQGPEELVREVLAAIRREAGLSEDEKKDFALPSISSEEDQGSGNATNDAV